MKTIKMQLPNLTTRLCWIGCYKGPINRVVVFSQLPKKINGNYDDYINNDIVAGRFDCVTFKEWFGVDYVPTSDKVGSIEQARLVANWERGIILGLDTWDK